MDIILYIHQHLGKYTFMMIRDIELSRELQYYSPYYRIYIERCTIKCKIYKKMFFIFFVGGGIFFHYHLSVMSNVHLKIGVLYGLSIQTSPFHKEYI